MNYIKLIRPKQWLKNSFVIAPLIFSGQFDYELLVISFQSLLIFIITSSCVYVFNDLKDLEYDKKHPKKKLRPIASGDISILMASFYLVFLVALDCLALYFFKTSMIGILLVVGYLLLNIFYSLGLKKVPLLELAILSSGFVIRLLFGSVETNIELSPWIILCSGLLSLMIAVGKRRSDLEQQSRQNIVFRKSLDGYTIGFLDQVNTLLASVTIMSYLLFSTSSYAINTIGNGVLWTAPFVIFSILRYLQLISVNNQGDDPTSMLVGDKTTITLFLTWFILITSIINLG
tara:strand:- start:25167 stop:26033 length:867 start_codon:yes stop_codon:yes gene_type:complete